MKPAFLIVHGNGFHGYTGTYQTASLSVFGTADSVAEVHSKVGEMIEQHGCVVYTVIDLATMKPAKQLNDIPNPETGYSYPHKQEFANCGCVYHAEDGVMCPHDKALLKE